MAPDVRSNGLHEDPAQALGVVRELASGGVVDDAAEAQGVEAVGRESTELDDDTGSTTGHDGRIRCWGSGTHIFGISWCSVLRRLGPHLTVSGFRR